MSGKEYRKRTIIDESNLTDIDLKRLDARRRNNRESAARARQRMKKTFDEMEQTIKSLQDETILLRDENVSLKVQAMTLAKENSELRCQLAVTNQNQELVRNSKTLNNGIGIFLQRQQEQQSVPSFTIAGNGIVMNSSIAFGGGNLPRTAASLHQHNT